MGRTIISTDASGDRAARVRLTTGQARTRVPGMTFRPGPSHLGGPRPSSTKDGGERGQHPEKTLARTRAKGTTPGFEGQAGSYIMAQKGTVGGSHFGGQSLHPGRLTQTPTASLPVLSPAAAAVWSPQLATSPQCECYRSLL